MAESASINAWVDRYVRDELDPGEQAQFEERLMVDAALQSEVEAALALRMALLQTRATDSGAGDSPAGAKNPWSAWALAASVVLAVTTTLLAWRGAVENNRLQLEIEALRSPAASVLTVPVDIMRSTGSTTPDVIIRKPADGLIVLDIEIAPALSKLPNLDFELRTESGAPLQTWQSAADADRRARVALRADSLPDGRVVLRMSGPGSDLADTRLIELRPAR